MRFRKATYACTSFVFLYLLYLPLVFQHVNFFAVNHIGVTSCNKIVAMLKFLKRQYPLLKRNYSTGEDFLLAQCIKERALLRLSGKDASVYMQGLITNDMKHLEDGATSMFAMFLNSKGRVMYDSLVYNSNNENVYFVECDAEAASPLREHLLRYKVRRKVNIDCLKDEFDVWTVISDKNFSDPNEVSDYKKIQEVIKQNLPNLVVTSDPRLSCMGLRVIAPKDYNLSNEIEKVTSLKTKEENFYKLLRYKLGIGEGLKELPSEKCFPMEANGDYLHGISFHKGCYIGQELTARTYHTGVIRKRIMPLVFAEEMKINENGVPIFTAPETSKSVGKLQGVEQTNGVGLLRIEEALKAEELVVLDAKCKTHRPFWWPSEAPKERMNLG